MQFQHDQRRHKDSIVTNAQISNAGFPVVFYIWPSSHDPSWSYITQFFTEFRFKRWQISAEKPLNFTILTFTIKHVVHTECRENLTKEYKPLFTPIF